MGVRSRRLRRASRAVASTEGWVRPFRQSGGDAARPVVTTVGNLDSPLEATVDARGLVGVAGAGWSLDWWVGADDRWHVPSREVAVRQRLAGDAPVVESAMRVPSGDVVQRVYAVRLGGDELVVVELENTSPVPVALAMALRPYDASGEGGLRRIELDGTVVRVDGAAGLLLSKEPARMAGSTGPRGDVAEVVLAGAAGTELPPVRCGEGRATAAFVWPLAHRTSMRFAVPLGDTALTSLPPLPSAEQVGNGWALHLGRGVRLVLPDDRLAAAVSAARGSLLLRHDGPAAQRSAAGPVARAMGVHGYVEEAGELLAADPLAAGLPALADHWRRHRDVALARSVAADVAELADRTERDLLDAAELLDAAGEGGAAASARRLAAAHAAPAAAPFRDEVDALLAEASPTFAWPEPDGPDAAPAARFLLAVRDRLVREVEGGLALASHVPDGWLGAGWEVHAAPTAFGAFSYGVRWHGDRPALLWELDAHDPAVTVRLTAPGLDPAWSTDEVRGEALLSPVLPAGTPVGLPIRRR